MSKKVSFNMLFDETQKEILEYCIDHVYSGAEVSKASFIQWLIKDTACDILGLDQEDRQGISDEMVLRIFKHEVEENQKRIRALNPERYDEIIKNIEGDKNNG